MPSKLSSKGNNKDNTLIILCGWLGANEKHLSKYVELWHKRNIDVLQVSTRWLDILMPPLTMGRSAPKVTNALNQIRATYPNMIFHTLSSGGYFYASVMDTIQHDQSMAQLKPHLKGFIADSLADWPWILANKQAMSEILSPTVVNALPAIKLTEILGDKQECPPLLRISPSNLDFFFHRNKIIRNNPFKLPGL